MSEVNYQLGFKIHDNGKIEKFNEALKQWEKVTHNGTITVGAKTYSVDALIYSTFRGKFSVDSYSDSKFTHLDEDPDNYDVSNLHLIEKIKEPEPVIPEKRRGRKPKVEKPKKIKMKKEKVKPMKKVLEVYTMEEALAKLSVGEDGTPMIDGAVRKVSLYPRNKVAMTLLPTAIAKALDTHPSISIARFNVLVKYKDQIKTEYDLRHYLNATIHKYDRDWMNNCPDNIYIGEPDRVPVKKAESESQPTFDDIFGEQYAEHPEDVKPEPLEQVGTTMGTVAVPIRFVAVDTLVKVGKTEVKVALHHYKDSAKDPSKWYVCVTYNVKSPLTGEDIHVQEAIPEDTICRFEF